MQTCVTFTHVRITLIRLWFDPRIDSDRSDTTVGNSPDPEPRVAEVRARSGSLNPRSRLDSESTMQRRIVNYRCKIDCTRRVDHVSFFLPVTLVTSRASHAHTSPTTSLTINTSPVWSQQEPQVSLLYSYPPWVVAPRSRVQLPRRCTSELAWTRLIL